MLLTLICLKPARDAFRIVSGSERELYETFDTVADNFVSKCAETFFEALPGAILQVNALLKSNIISKTAVSSIALSTCSVSFTLQSMAYDFDVDLQKRRIDPQRRGYIPDKNRGVDFVLMMAISAFTMVSQVFTYVLVGRLGSTVLFLWWLGPALPTLGRKAARKGDPGIVMLL